MDSDRGWAVGSRGTLLSTHDGGKSWQAKPQPTEDVIRDLYFADEQNGWLLCERNVYDLKSNDEPRAYLMKTGDGGERWQRANMRGANVDARLLRALFNP
ncbi:MAG: WD40/YVTN/BNR-like repeat-containing protein, partial [Pyrinomonadaceae bacterium]